MRLFTLSELGKFDGTGGSPAYVAYKGKVYDVSESFLWKDGKHQGMHRAGRDLTRAIERAPHGPEFLERYPVVGRLQQAPKPD